MRAYSPSQTTTWIDCPIKRALAYQEKWMPRRYGKRELAAILGGGVAAGLGAYYHFRGACEQWDGQSISTKPYVDIAVQVTRARLRELEEIGAVVNDYDRAQQDALPDRVQRAVEKYITWDVEGRAIPHAWLILDVERTLPDHGHARLDLGVDDGQGPAVVDHKVKLQLKREYRQRELDRYRHSWQMLHYAWAYGAVLGRPIRRYYINLIVLEPQFSVELVPFSVEPEHMAQWEQSARRVWAQMEREDQGIEHPWMAAKHADEYGNCEFAEACLTHKWDPALMAAEYVRKEAV
jgi:PD-(D/E)XK nuclease superfamily